MTPRTMARCLADDAETVEVIVKHLELHPGVGVEAVLQGAEARLDGIRRAGRQPDSGLVLWAVDATLDDLSRFHQDGPVGAKIAGAPPAAISRGPIPGAGESTLRGFQCVGTALRLGAKPLGGGRATILISRRDPPERLYFDTASLGSAKVRRRILEALPDDVQTEATRGLEDLAVQVLNANGSASSQRDLQGTAVEFEEVEPWPDSLDGADLVEEVVRSIRRHVVISEYGAVAAALWILHTHALAAADVSPILGISSPAKRCGKTTLQSVLRHLVRRPLPASNISGAALFRTIEKHQPTVLLDEADSYLTENEEMRNLLNAGVRRDDAYVYRVVGDDHEPRCFSVFAPKTVSLIGRLPETLEDRAIIVRLERKKKTETVERLRGRSARETFEPLRRKAATWTADHLEELRELEPAIPESLNDRAADFWEPLLAIADAVGGVWPDGARRAATVLSGEEDLHDNTPAIHLLSDLRDVLIASERGRISSKALAEALASLEERPWGSWHHGKPITPNQVSRFLKRFGITPRTLRLPENERAKGYDLGSCQDVFDRYLPPLNVPTGEESSHDPPFER